MTRPLAVSVDEAARLLGLSRSSAYLAVQRGDIPSVAIGRRILIPMKRLEEMLGISPDEERSPASAMAEAPVINFRAADKKVAHGST